MDDLHGESISKVFPGGAQALEQVSFRARAGRVLTLLGPSGCGKSTLLRIVAGLERATSGRLCLGEQAFDALPAGHRDVGFVFQNYALYPHLSVEGNLSLALRARGARKEDVAARVRRTAELLGIGDLLARRPGQLSGGQQQRVALGRALVKEPRLYLLDEPLSNLDALLRESMRSELKLLFRRLSATVLYVTHDQAEAMSLSDEVLLLKEGRVRQCAPPLELYARPADLFVATFVGSPRMNAWQGECAEGGLQLRGLRLDLPAGLPCRPRLWAGLRPEDVEVQAAPFAGGWEARLEVAEPLGDRVLLTLRVGEQSLRALAPPREWSQRLWVRAAPERLHWFDAVTEARLEPGGRRSDPSG